MSDLLVESAERVLVLTMNRPAARNAMSAEMRQALVATLTSERETPRHKAILLTGTGGAFCAGADLNLDTILERRRVIEGQMQTGVNRLIALVRDIPIPVVASVDGPAAGAGFGLALACDIMMVSDRASFHLSFSKIGASPDAGVIKGLVSRIGAARATALAMLGEAISAEEAEQLGMAHRRTSSDKVFDMSMALAQRLAAGPSMSYAMTKRLVNAAGGAADEATLALEAALQARAFASDDFEEGVTAFAEKRSPIFRGI